MTYSLPSIPIADGSVKAVPAPLGITISSDNPSVTDVFFTDIFFLIPEVIPVNVAFSEEAFESNWACIVDVTPIKLDADIFLVAFVDPEDTGMYVVLSASVISGRFIIFIVK